MWFGCFGEFDFFVDGGWWGGRGCVVELVVVGVVGEYFVKGE